MAPHLRDLLRRGRFSVHGRNSERWRMDLMLPLSSPDYPVGVNIRAAREMILDRLKDVAGEPTEDQVLLAELYFVLEDAVFSVKEEEW